MKKCGTCKNVLENDSFGFRAASKDGLAAKCKKCQSEYDKKRARLPKRVKARLDYSKTVSGKEAGSRAKKAWADRNILKRAAHILTGNAIRSGKIAKEPCEQCGKSDLVHAHHDDYKQPLNVRWLCPVCHKEWHEINGSGKNP